MKTKILSTLFILLTLAGCASKTQYGSCIGAFDDKDPHLVYKLSIRNVAIAVFTAGLIIPPIKVLADETMCPVERRE